MNDKKKIKKLAKESLEDKWYPLKRGDKGISVRDGCAFCKNIKKKGCKSCYIEKIEPNFCMFLSEKDIDYIIKFLEQLTKFGEL